MAPLRPGDSLQLVQRAKAAKSLVSVAAEIDQVWKCTIHGRHRLSMLSIQPSQLMSRPLTLTQRQVSLFFAFVP